MVFSPFTGINSHNKSTTFTAALISKEDVPSFVWIFQTFLKAMNEKEPLCLITDQDPAMKVAVKEVMKETKRRFCMWHIMEKIPKKVSFGNLSGTNFKEEIKEVVWSWTMTIDEFEKKWPEIMKKCNLEDNAWLQQLFEMREDWIPAYFHDFPMARLMRTTSRSESQNRAFRRLTDKYLSLVHFMWRFDGVVNNQREETRYLAMKSATCHPQYKLNKELERHAWNLYTLPIFFKVQKYMMLTNKLTLYNMKDKKTREGITKLYFISDDSNSKFILARTVDTNHFDCSCKRFQARGLLCIHIFLAMRNARMKLIPDSMVNLRWCRETAREDQAARENMDPEDTKKLIEDIKKRFVELIEVPDPSFSNLQSLFDSLKNTTIHNNNEDYRLTKMQK